MKRILIASMLASLGACGSSEVPEDRVFNQIDAEMARREANRAATAANGMESAPPSLPSEASPTTVPGPVDRARLVGRWGATPACQGASTEFRDDGTFSTPSSSGRWTLEGSRLTLTSDGDEVRATMLLVNALEFQARSDSGGLLNYYRCTSQAR
jgi:hypothetical protein